MATSDQGLTQPTPFRVDVSDRVLDDLNRRLDNVRYAPDFDGDDDWSYGVPGRYLRELVDFWRHSYDWRAHEARLNQHAQFTTHSDGQRIHFVHERADNAGAPALLLSHGWPGSIAEFVDVIPRLTHPERFGGDSADALHVVVPSLPGYGFSGPTTTPGWNVGRIAQSFAALMQHLGYRRYFAQGGDWGAQITTRLGIADADHCAAIHLNMPLANPPKDGAALDETELADLAALQAFQRDEAAYSLEQGTKPHTLGAALSDSPVGLLAWIVEKFRSWSDCGGHPENVFTRDQLLTNVMIYWVTDTITSSMRLYWEARAAGYGRELSDRVQVPTGIGRYPKEVLRYPRSWVEARYNVTRWSELTRGGHFAAMEQPELFAADVREFFRSFR